jgi:hypothetical protein
VGIYEDADQRASAALDDILGSDLIWRPMLPATGGGRFIQSTSSARPDPDRPASPIRGIVTWRSTIAGVSPTATGAIANAALTVEMPRDQAAFDTWGWPREGDRLEIINEDRAIPGAIVEINRLPAVGAQLLAHCSVIRPPA